MRTFVVVLSEPSEQKSLAVTIKDPYHELTFERIESWLDSATYHDVFRDKHDLLCNRHNVETLVDVIDEGDTPTVHFIYSNTEWSDFIDKLAKAFVSGEPHYRNFCTVKAAAALLTRAEPTLSDLTGVFRGMAYIEE
jgi:hypothetical protein